jgi:hypothetical protein
MKTILILLCLSHFFVGTAIAENRVFIVGVEPKQNPVIVAEQWMPFLRDLSSLSDTELRFRTSRDVLEYNRAIKSGEFDFVIKSPYLTTVFVQKYGIQPIAKLRHETDVSGLALIGKKDRTVAVTGQKTSVGVANDQRHADLQTISQYLSQMNHSYMLETYRSKYEVVEAVREGLSQFGVVRYQGHETTQYIISAGLDILWIDEQPKFSYLSAVSNIGEKVLEDLRDVLASSDNGESWAQQYGIAQIEVLGTLLSIDQPSSLSWIKVGIDESRF